MAMTIIIYLAFSLTKFQIISQYLHAIIECPPLCSESKYIQIETKDELSLGKFIDELQQADIINHLSQDTSSDPNENYDKFIEIVLSAKAKHLPTKKKKFNRRKHRIQKWVTKGIIKSINRKDKMYKKLVQFFDVTMNYMKYLKHNLTHIETF